MSGKKMKVFRRTVKEFTSDTIDGMQTVILRKPLKKRIKIAFCIIFRKSFDVFGI